MQLSHEGRRGLQRDFVGVQYLRAAAASMVVIYHSGNQTARAGIPLDHLGWLATGVDIFFVISGLIMWTSTAARNVGPVQFWRRRIRRIVPLYWLVTAFMVMMLLVAPSLVKSGRFDLWHVVSSFLFIPSIHPVVGIAQPVLIPGWSLNYEMFFYLVFGAALVLSENARLVAVLSGLGCLTLVGALIKPQGTFAAFYTSSYLMEFAAGVIIARVAPLMSLGKVAAVSLLLVGFLLLPFSSTIGGRSITIVASAFIVLGVVRLDLLGVVPLRQMPHFLGDASYSIYLTHVVALSALGQVWERLHLFDMPLAVPLYVANGLVASLCVGGIVYWFVERPMLAGGSARRVPATA